MGIGEKIKCYMESVGISQLDLCEKTKITPTKLNLSLNGKRNLKFEEYERICWALDVNTDKFISPKQPN